MTRQKFVLSAFIIASILFVVIQSHDHGKTKLGTQSSQNYIDSSNKVTYASLIKLRHHNTQYWLHAHDVIVQRGGIYSVTAYRDDDHGSYWQVLEQYDIPKKTKTYKDVLKCGQNIMLYGSISDYYLRTQDTTFGLTTELIPLVHGIKKEQIDHGVVWNVHCVDKENGQEVVFGDKIRLKHDTSGKYVSTDGSSFYTEGNCGRGCGIVGQLELHAIDNGHYSEHAVFQILGGLTFDQQSVQQNTKEQ